MPEQKCLLVKTASEISLKSPFVRRFFTKKLDQSIKFALKRNGIALDKIARGGGMGLGNMLFESLRDKNYTTDNIMNYR